MDLTELSLHNPWWSSGNWEGQDYHLQKMKKNKYIYEREEYVPFKKGVYVVYGPRQVGKTTWIKQAIQKLAKNKKSTDVFYLNIEVIKDRFELHKVLSDVLSLYNPNFIFLDEVGAVLDWEKAVKILVEEGRLENKTVVLTGSSSINILKKAERLPGRMARGQYKFRYYPLSFKEVVKVYGMEINSPKDAVSKLDELNNVLFNYFLHGGFIPAINVFADEKTIPEELFSVYSGWIDGELAKEKRSSETATYFMDSAVNSMANDINWNSLVKGVSQPTVASYAELLEDMFVISYIEKSARPLEGVPRNKKVYFADPFLYWLACFRAHKIHFADKSLLDNVTLGKLAEQALFSNIMQYLDGRTKENEFNVRRYVRFEKDRKGETDFIVKLGKNKLRLESKFGAGEATPSRRGDVCITRTEFSGQAIPLSVFLLFPEESLKLLEKL